MATFLYLIHDDAGKRKIAEDMAGWGRFIEGLRGAGHFVGGGPLGGGRTRRGATAGEGVSREVVGYMVVEAESLERATRLLDECPTVRGGGSVEVREVMEV